MEGLEFYLDQYHYDYYLPLHSGWWTCISGGDWQAGVCPLPTYPRLVRSGSVKRISSCSAIPPIRSRIDQPESPYVEMSKSCWFPGTASAADESLKTEVPGMLVMLVFQTWFRDSDITALSKLSESREYLMQNQNA